MDIVLHLVANWCIELNYFFHPIDEFYNNASKFDDGKVADYIPQLAKLNPDIFGVSICTVDGQRYSIGDCADPFTLQSCWYAMAFKYFVPNHIQGCSIFLKSEGVHLWALFPKERGGPKHILP